MHVASEASYGYRLGPVYNQRSEGPWGPAIAIRTPSAEVRLNVYELLDERAEHATFLRTPDDLDLPEAIVWLGRVYRYWGRSDGIPAFIELRAWYPPPEALVDETPVSAYSLVPLVSDSDLPDTARPPPSEKIQLPESDEKKEK